MGQRQFRTSGEISLVSKAKQQHKHCGDTLRFGPSTLICMRQKEHAGDHCYVGNAETGRYEVTWGEPGSAVTISTWGPDGKVHSSIFVAVEKKQ